MKWPLHTCPLAHSYFASGMGILALTRRNSAACLGVIPPGTDFVRGDGVGRRLNMGYGISKAAGGGKGQAGGVREGEGEGEGEREALLRSVSAGSQSFEGFLLNGKKGGKGR